MSRHVLPKGFVVSGLHCGVKKFNKDIGLIYSRFPCKAVGVFTKNKIKAAPILVTREILSKGESIYAVIINSGNANCCTGKYGTQDAKAMVHAVCKGLNLNYNNVCVASTGIIGKRLPIDRIVSAVPKAIKQLSEKRIMSLAKAILTTDKKRKIETAKFNVGHKEVVITGVCKGAGMIHPHMATMLCFIATDANIEKTALNSALKKIVKNTFNVITVDGDMSTNDCVLLLANGQAGNNLIKKETKEFAVFMETLEQVVLKLAKDIIKDGEGATKFVTVTIIGAKSEKDAETVARTIANSCLVKTSVYGQDGNWGRVASSVGASGVHGIKPNRIEIYLDGVCMLKKGGFTHPSAARVSRIYKRKHVEITINLNAGKKSAQMFTCDLSKRYVDINAHYPT